MVHIFLFVRLYSGYHHIAQLPHVQMKYAFVTPVGKLKIEEMLFGLAQAPIHFQQLKNEVLKGLPCAYRYFDDILVFSENKHLRTVFDRL